MPTTHRPGPADAGVTFRATVELMGRTATGIRVPEVVVRALGPHKQPLVRVTIGDHTYLSKVAARRGDFLLPVSAENRVAARVAAGQAIDVTLKLDTVPRQVSVPADLAAALAAAPEASRFFDTLSYSRKLPFVLGLEGARTPETRRRRIASAVAMLRQGRASR